MKNLITQAEIEFYNQLRAQGIPVRECGRILGRSGTNLHKYDRFRKARGSQSDLEQAITEPVEFALYDALVPPEREEVPPRQVIWSYPKLQARIRRLVRAILKIIGDRNTLI